MDNLSVIIIIVCGGLIISTLYHIVGVVADIIKRRRKFVHNGFKDFAGVILSFLVIVNVAYCIYNMPYVIYRINSWQAIELQGPYNLIIIAIALAVLIPVFYIYILLSIFFIKRNEKPFFIVAVLSITSGIGSSLMVFVLNLALNRNDRQDTGLYAYYILGIVMLTICTYLSRKKLITVTNFYVFDKRIDIINVILKAPYESVEKLGSGKIYAGLNNDPETVSGFIGILISGVTSIITVICCLIYIGMISFMGLLLSLFAILISTSLFMLVDKSLRRFYEKNRDIQNAFFKFITEMNTGFKELFINKSRSNEFRNDMSQSCASYRDTRVQAEMKSTVVILTSMLLINIVIGLTVFLFPYMNDLLMDYNTLRSYVLVYLYMVGPITTITTLFPSLMGVRVSWNRIKELNESLSAIETREIETKGMKREGDLEIKIKGIAYSYKNEEDQSFSIGPIDNVFKSGELVFITGGNGSGKSTLAKILAGMYMPQEGEILVNNEKVDYEVFIKNNLSAIFGDFFLFDKLYGIDMSDKEEDLVKYLKKLRIEEKVQVKDGEFSTTKLSSGQRKRLALMISYLEDRPFYIFDEWAADQDPEFKRVFYEVLLPELKAARKCIIAITHDDHYFHTADRVIKMDMGLIEQDVLNSGKRDDVLQGVHA